MSQTDERLSSFTESDLQGNDAMILFYTGLPTFQILKEVFGHVSLAVAQNERSKLTSFEEFMLVMIKWRLKCKVSRSGIQIYCLNAKYLDLAYRFTV